MTPGQRVKAVRRLVLRVQGVQPEVPKEEAPSQVHPAEAERLQWSKDVEELVRCIDQRSIQPSATHLPVLACNVRMLRMQLYMHGCRPGYDLPRLPGLVAESTADCENSRSRGTSLGTDESDGSRA